MTSQPTKVRTRSAECTTRSMPAQNSETVAAKTPYRSSSRRYQAANACTAQPTRATTAATRAGRALVCSSRGTWSAPASRAGSVRAVWTLLEPPTDTRPARAAASVASEKPTATSRAAEVPRRARNSPAAAARAGRSTTRRAAARLIGAIPRPVGSPGSARSGPPEGRLPRGRGRCRRASRKTASTTASATQTSAAAMVMTNRVRTFPACQVSAPTDPVATRRTLAAFRTSSTPMRTSTALRRARTP